MASEGKSLPLRELGRLLRRWREDQGLSLEEAANSIRGIKKTALHTLEKGGKANPKENDILEICRTYGMDAHSTAAAVGLATQAASADWWWHPYGGLIPAEFDVYMGLESMSHKLTSFQPNLIPGLLQTSSYVLALLRKERPSADPDDWEKRVQIKAGRKRILTRANPIEFDVVIGQAALHHVVGGPDTMAAQLRHLTEMTGLHPNICLRVLPFEAGFPSGVAVPPFVILERPEQRTVFLENVRGGIYLEKKADLDFYDLTYETIRQACKTPQESQSLLTRIAKEYDRER
ncbi:helix-turn-helix domain-containing protein [Nocardia sp. NPDC057668]|uniref:helix-turn-helix domain-containing protein n=1 Tax=Nocardia sp. NPDC057668 TaxID=3346202 RepID=UPI00366BE68F